MESALEESPRVAAPAEDPVTALARRLRAEYEPRIDEARRPALAALERIEPLLAQ